MTEAARKVTHNLQKIDMKVWAAVFVVFSFVCSGGYGIEDMVSESGPGFTLLLLMILPFVWGLPQALVCSELGSAMPDEGGLYRWTRASLGEFWGFNCGWWWVVSIFVDSAVYIALTVDYMQSWFGLSGLERWLLAVVLIVIFTAINIVGLKMATWVLIALQVVVFIPFVSLAVIGLFNWNGNPFNPILPPGETVFGGLGVGLAIGMWMYSGFESLSTMAGEIKRPQKVIPKALMFTLPIVIAFYVLSTMGGIATVGRWDEWMTSGGLDFMEVGGLAGGEWLRYAFFAGMLAGNFALFVAFLAAGARPAYVLSRDKLLPGRLGRTNKKFGTPHVAIILMAVVDIALVGYGFETLIVIDVFLLMFAHIMIYLSAMRLRYKRPDMKRPFRVPLPNWAFVLMCLVPISIAVLALFSNGTDYLVGGFIGVLSGPAAYLILKPIYKGRKKPAEIHAEGDVLIDEDDDAGAAAATAAPAEVMA